VSLYFWLGIDAEPPEADEQAQYEIVDNPDGGFTARLEGDDWITIYTFPKIQTPPSH
jgi:hypothetical protein